MNRPERINDNRFGNLGVRPKSNDQNFYLETCFIHVGFIRLVFLDNVQESRSDDALQRVLARLVVRIGCEQIDQLLHKRRVLDMRSREQASHSTV